MDTKLTKEQKDKEDSDSVLKRCEDELSQFQALEHSSRSSLWSALLTINGIFIAFTLNQSYWPRLIHLGLMVLFIIPALIILGLFYADKYSKSEFLQAYSLITTITKKKLREQDTQKEAYSAIYHNRKAQKANRMINSTGIILEKIAIGITGFSIFSMIFLQLFFK